MEPGVTTSVAKKAVNSLQNKPTRTSSKNAFAPQCSFRIENPSEEQKEMIYGASKYKTLVFNNERDEYDPAFICTAIAATSRSLYRDSDSRARLPICDGCACRLDEVEAWLAENPEHPDRDVPVDFFGLCTDSDELIFQNFKSCANCFEPEGTDDDSRRHLRCAKCKDAFYCSKQCQQDDWNMGDHKIVCYSRDLSSLPNPKDEDGIEALSRKELVELAKGGNLTQYGVDGQSKSSDIKAALMSMSLYPTLESSSWKGPQGHSLKFSLDALRVELKQRGVYDLGITFGVNFDLLWNAYKRVRKDAWQGAARGDVHTMSTTVRVVNSAQGSTDVRDFVLII